MSESAPAGDESALEAVQEATGVSYDPGADVAAFTGSGTDTDQYVSLVAYLLEEGYIRRADLPVSARRARTRYLLNASASHRDGAMVRPREVADGVFVETNHDTSSKRRYAATLLEAFVLE